MIGLKCLNNPKGPNKKYTKFPTPQGRLPPLPCPVILSAWIECLGKSTPLPNYRLERKDEFVTQTELVALVTSIWIVQDQNECIHHLCAHGSFIKGINFRRTYLASTCTSLYKKYLMKWINSPIRTMLPNFSNTLVKIYFMNLRLSAHGHPAHVHFVPIIMVHLKNEIKTQVEGRNLLLASKLWNKWWTYLVHKGKQR